MRAPLVLAMALVVGGCSRAEILARNFSRSPEVCAEGVVFYTSAGQVPGSYREVALLSIQRVGGREEARRVGEAVRRHAGELGANAVVMTSAPSATSRLLGPAVGDPARRMGMGVAIEVLADTARVAQACRSSSQGQSPIINPHPTVVLTSSGTREMPFRGLEYSARTRRRPTAHLVGADRPFDLSGRGADVALASARAPFDGSAFLRNPDVRSALLNLERLKIATGAEEVGPGLLRVSIGEMAPEAQMEYHIGYLHGSYVASLPYGESGTVELWRNGTKVGEYTRKGLVLTIRG